MRLAILTSLAAATSLVTAHYDHRKVLEDLAEMSADTQSPTSTVNSVLSDIRHGALDAKLSDRFGDTGSNNVSSAILKLQFVTFASLDGLEKKRPEFDKKIAGVTPSKIVLKSLQDSKKASDGFAANVAAKLNDFFRKCCADCAG